MRHELWFVKSCSCAGYKEFSQALETVAAELGISFEQMAAKIMDRQATYEMAVLKPSGNVPPAPE